MSHPHSPQRFSHRIADGARWPTLLRWTAIDFTFDTCAYAGHLS